MSKLIYEFSIDKEVETIKKTERKKRGSDETVITEKKVKEKIPVKIQLCRPSRRQLEDAELEYSVEMSKCIKKGILTKAMLAKKYSDTGGLFSEEDSKRYGELYSSLLKLQTDFQRLEIVEEKSDKQKKRLDEIREELAYTQREIVEMESAFHTLFEHTADNKAQAKLLLWYSLFLTKIYDEDLEEFVPYFKGDTFEEKTQDFYAKEEEGDEFYHKVANKISTVLAVWFFNKASSEEEFQGLLDKIEQGEM